MKILKPRTDFVIVEDYFSSEQAAEWLSWILKMGTDPVRGFHHPDLRPNRFHTKPKYPVKKYMCLGLYWNPLDYHYDPQIPETKVKPFPIPERIMNMCQDVLNEFFPWPDFSPESVLVNFYTNDSSLGMHVDKDEENHKAPVIGLNFGSACRFRFEDENGQMQDVKIMGNSIYIFGGKARLMPHGVGNVYSKTLSPGSEAFLENKERLNLTIRQVY